MKSTNQTLSDLTKTIKNADDYVDYMSHRIPRYYKYCIRNIEKDLQSVLKTLRSSSVSCRACKNCTASFNLDFVYSNVSCIVDFSKSRSVAKYYRKASKTLIDIEDAWQNYRDDFSSKFQNLFYKLEAVTEEFYLIYYTLRINNASSDFLSLSLNYFFMQWDEEFAFYDLLESVYKRILSFDKYFSLNIDKTIINLYNNFTSIGSRTICRDQVLTQWFTDFKEFFNEWNYLLRSKLNTAVAQDSLFHFLRAVQNVASNLTKCSIISPTKISLKQTCINIVIENFHLVLIDPKSEFAVGASSYKP